MRVSAAPRSRAGPNGSASMTAAANCSGSASSNFATLVHSRPVGLAVLEHGHRDSLRRGAAAESLWLIVWPCQRGFFMDLTAMRVLCLRGCCKTQGISGQPVSVCSRCSPFRRRSL